MNPAHSYPHLLMLGTGSAFPTVSYNTCFILRDTNLTLLVDAGGGNQIIDRLKQCRIDVATLTHFFITHAHTDHILGAVWVIRALINSYLKETLKHKIQLLGNSDVLNALDIICRLTLLESHYKLIPQILTLTPIDAPQVSTLANHEITFFDVGSQNVNQTGFRIKLTSGREFVFLGDESLTPRNADYCKGSDYVMCGAFCRHADAAVFKPYEKHHHTVRDVAREATKINAPNLILIHAEDSDLPSRATAYAVEASLYYHGNTIVPVDGDIIPLQ